MSRPKTYQKGAKSAWYGLDYRIAHPCKIGDGRWKTTLYLVTPYKKTMPKGGVEMCSRKGEGEQDLMARAKREIQCMAIEYVDVILDAVRSGTWPGMTLETYAALRRGVIQSYNKWAGKAGTYWRHWDKRLRSAVGEVELLQCGDPSELEEKIEQLTHRKRSKRGYTDEERMDWIILGDLLECAYRADGLLAGNPLRAQARKCREKLSTVASQALARRDLTAEEVAALLDTCLAHPGEAVYEAMILQLLTGMTVSELCALNVGDWQRGNAVSWIEITKAYKQVRGQEPVMTKMLDDAGNYRRVVCTGEVEQVLSRLVYSHKGKSRMNRGAPLITAPDGARLSPSNYKAFVRDVLDGIILGGARLPFVERGGVLRGSNRPTVAHTDLLRNTAVYYFRTVCRCTDAERAAILGLRQEHTFAATYVDWANELVLLYLRGKLARWHGRILYTAQERPLGRGGYQLLMMAQPGSHLTVHAQNGVSGTIQERKDL